MGFGSVPQTNVGQQELGTVFSTGTWYGWHICGGGQVSGLHIRAVLGQQPDLSITCT